MAGHTLRKVTSGMALTLGYCPIHRLDSTRLLVSGWFRLYLLISFLNNGIRSSRYTPVLERFNLNYMYRNFHFIVRFEADGVALSFVFGLLLFYVKVRCYVKVFNTLKSCTDIRNKTWNSRWLSATFIMYTSSLP